MDNSNILPGALRYSLKQSYEVYLKNHPNVDAEEADHKRKLIEHFVINDHLDWPTQGLVEDWMDVHYLDLLSLECHGIYFDQSYCYLDAPHLISQECHAAAALNWVLNPTLQIFSGFSDQAHFHSWLYDASNMTVLEPTPHKRGSYFGYCHEDVLDFVEGEEGNIKQFAENGTISQALYEKFTTALAALRLEHSK